MRTGYVLLILFFSELRNNGINKNYINPIRLDTYM